MTTPPLAARSQAVIVLRSLKGAPLSVLVALAMLGRSGTGDLEIATGYDTEAVGKALRTLAGLGYVQNTGRYYGWQLTSQAVQLPLFTPSELEREVGKTDLPLLCGGGGLNDTRALTNDVLTTTTTRGEVGNSDLEVGKTDLPAGSAPSNGRRGPNGSRPVDNPVDNLVPRIAPDPETTRLAEILVQRAQCRRPGALTAVAAAHAAGASLAEIEIEILRWAAWYEDKDARKTGLNNPPGYILRKLAEREPAATRHVKAWSEDSYRIDTLLRQLHPEDWDDPDADDTADPEE